MNKRIPIMVVLLMVLTSLISYASATEYHVYASSVYSSTSCLISNDGTTITGKVTIKATATASKIGIITLNIQEKRSGSWVTVKSMSSSYSYDTVAYSNKLSYSGRTGYQYRVTSECTATVNGTSEKKTVTSSIITL